MDKKNIKNLYNQKNKLINKYNQYYYDKNKPLVSDQEYDDLKKDILLLEEKYNFLKSKNSPSKIVGFKPSKIFAKVSHRVPMLSLSNAFTEDDLNNFEKKIQNFISQKDSFLIEYSAEPKIDGISASLIYKNGNFVKGLSRGDGKEGEDITENLKTINDIPKKILSNDFPKEIDIRGEVFIENRDFVSLDGNFSNPRNAASGSLRQKNSEQTKKIPLKFIAYTFGYESGLKVDNQFQFLKKLKEWGFKTNPLNKLISGVNNLMKNYFEVEKKRNQIDFDIDGIVYKINDFKLQKRLGNIANAPRWAVAHKFSSNKAVSKILNIDIQIGRTGALTPVAKIKPTNIGGVVVSNASLHNEDEINRKDIRVGDTVTIERAGDVIPHILHVDFSQRKGNVGKFIFPKNCPSCGSKTEKEYNLVTKKIDAVRRCTSEGYECEKVAIEKIKHFVSKEAFNIEGLGKKIVESFYKIKLIKYPQDIFNLDYSKIQKLEGWGNKSVANLKYSIEQKKRITLDRLIYAIGIRHIGLENAKILSNYFNSLDNFLSFLNKDKFKDLLNIDGIGETQVNSIKKFCYHKSNLQVLNELKKILFVQNALAIQKDGLLKNKTFMITGKLEDISRAEAKSIIEKNSGTIVSSVTKKLNFLIIGDKPTKRKVDAANDLKIRIINKDQFFNMLKKTS